jgi:hypothetical protein
VAAGALYNAAMRKTLCLISILVSGIKGFAATDCDRPCLRGMLDQYLNAVIKHDPSAAPLMTGFRQTENSVVVKNGTGVWKSVTALGKLQRRYLDAVSGQAAYFGIVEEGSGSAIVTARIKVDNRKISEAEWFMARKGDPGLNGPQQPGQPAGNFFDPDNLAMNPPPERSVAKGERLPRESLIGITNSYFDGITTHDGSIILAHPGCMRLENGNTVTPRAASEKGPATDCTSNLANINVQLVAGRRYPVVDEEANVVLALATFIRKPGTTTRRNMFSEWFVIDAGKIRSIYSAMFYPAPEAPVPNWPPYEGNWPLK